MGLVTLSLQPKQLQFRNLCFTTGVGSPNIIGVGGARAGGKSGGLRRVMLERRLQRPGTPGVIVRRLWSELKENHLEKYFLEIPELRDYYRASDKEIRLPNGSRIAFRFAENQQDVDAKFWGPEWYDIFVDQAEQFSEQEITIMKSANRSDLAAPGDCKMLLFFNPGGIGTEYLRRVFPKQDFRPNENAGDFAFVHMFGWDNYVWAKDLMSPEEFYALPATDEQDPGCRNRFDVFVNETQEGRKLNSLPPSLRAGHLLGSFDSFAGQYFAGVWDESRIILNELQEARMIQSWWVRWMSHDTGFVHHACIIWWATGRLTPKQFLDIFGIVTDRDHTVMVAYRDQTEAEVEEGEFVRQAIEKTTAEERKTMQRYFLGQDANEEDSRGRSVKKTVTDELRRVGMPFPEDADAKRIGGWRFLYAAMKKTCDVLRGKCAPTRVNDDYESDEEGNYSESTPLLFVAGRCRDVIEAVPILVRDNRHPGRAEDVLKLPTKADDVGDGLRYGAKSMMNPRAVPLTVQKQEKWQELEREELPVHNRVMAMKEFDRRHPKSKGARRRSAGMR